MKYDKVPLKKSSKEELIHEEVKKKAIEDAQKEREQAIKEIERIAIEKEKSLWTRGNPSRHKALREMDCYEEMHDRLCTGVVITELARWIQEVKRERLDIARSTLMKSLYEYKAELPPELLTEPTQLYVKKHIETVERNINELTELEELYLLQLSRIGIDVKSEKQINKLFKSTGGEISLAKDILMDMAKIKQDLGIMGKVADKLDVNMSGGSSTTIMNVGGTNLDETQITKMGLAAESLIQVLSQTVVSPKEGEVNKDSLVDRSTIEGNYFDVDTAPTNRLDKVQLQAKPEEDTEPIQDVGPKKVALEDKDKPVYHWKD